MVKTNIITSPKAKIRLRTATFVENNGLILLVHDPVYRGGCWMLPGGGVEFNETVPQAAEREVFEETGLIITATGVLAVREIWEPENDYPNNKNMVRRSFEIFLKGKYKSGKIDISNNPSHKLDGISRIKNCKWFILKDLGSNIDNVPIYPEDFFRSEIVTKKRVIPLKSILLKSIYLT